MTNWTNWPARKISSVPKDLKKFFQKIFEKVLTFSPVYAII